MDPKKSYQIRYEPDLFATCEVSLLGTGGEIVSAYMLQTSAELEKVPMPGKYHDRYGVSPDPGCYQLSHDLLVDHLAGSCAFGGAVLAEFVRDFLKVPPAAGPGSSSIVVDGGAVESWLSVRGLAPVVPEKTDLENAGLTGDAPNPAPEG